MRLPLARRNLAPIPTGYGSLPAVTKLEEKDGIQLIIIILSLIEFLVIGKMIPETKRKKDLYRMQKILAEDLPDGFLIRPDIIDPVRANKLEGYVATMGGVSTWINPWTYFKVHLKK